MSAAVAAYTSKRVPTPPPPWAQGPERRMGTGYVSNSHSGGSLTANVPIRIDPLKHVSNVCLFVLLVASKSGEYRGAHQHALTQPAPLATRHTTRKY